MEGYKTYRHESNPKEKELHDKFLKHISYDDDIASSLVFGRDAKYPEQPKQYLKGDEEKIVLSTIQWLGSPVGQSFLRDCGFELKE